MRDLIKKAIFSVLPPLFTSMVKRILPGGWSGDYKSWEDAELHTTGYDDEVILNRVHESLLKVKSGVIKYERDSVLFDEIQYSWPLLAGMMMAAGLCKGKISVLDFGGSLGSTYFQNKKFLDYFNNVAWCIVEQQNFVNIGKEDFEDGRMKFYSSVELCLLEHSINILVLSSVLEYIKSPYELLSRIIPKINADFIIIDRTPFIEGVDRIAVQTVPASIYRASYPCHLFNQENMDDFIISQGYTLLEEFESTNDGNYDKIQFLGLIYIKNDI
jgi:putative methyltransferase (TIGR04325 family)